MEGTSSGGETTVEDVHCQEEFQSILQGLRPDSPQWGWDRKTAKNICPGEVVFKEENNSTAIFHPFYAFGTAAVFGQRALDAHTINYWEVTVPRFYGTSMMIGLGSHRAKTHSPVKFEHLLGGDGNRHSFGLAHNGFLYGGGGKVQRYCQPLAQDKEVVVGVLFHGPAKWLAYFLDGKPLGIAFRGLDAEVLGKLFPMISSTAQKSHFTVGKQLIAELPRRLTSMCLKTISDSIRGDVSLIGDLNIPLVLAEALHQNITNRKNAPKLRANRRSREKKQLNAEPNTSLLRSSPTARKRRKLVNSTIIQQYDAGSNDEIERQRLSQLVVSGHCQLQSLLLGTASRASVDQKLLKRTRV